MTWTHPTGASPTTVTLVALGPSQHDRIGVCLEPEFPSEFATDETWTLNRGVYCIPHDLLFVMDHIQGEADRYPAYGATLWRHRHPIITSDNCNGWPPHVLRYPFAEINAWITDRVSPCHGGWFHNSLAYILCYAAFIGVRELHVWGADYHHHRSGRVEDGHPNVAYWAGVLERVGLSVKTTESSTFLGANQRDYIYGYQTDPRQEAGAKRLRFLELINA